MDHLYLKIHGTPYAHAKTKGDLEGPKAWTEAIIEQTRDLPKVAEACILQVSFLLPPDKYPADYPYGPDLDNLLKRLLDALSRTVFSNAAGHDSCVIAVNAMKAQVRNLEDVGASIQILPVSV